MEVICVACLSERQTDRQTDRQTGRQRQRETDAAMVIDLQKANE